MLINTAFGVANVRNDWIRVAQTHELSQLRTAFTVILPAAAPTILTGMRISIGIAWLVIVAAEMLVGGTGIGYYVWNEWNNLDLNSVIFFYFNDWISGYVVRFGFIQYRKVGSVSGVSPIYEFRICVYRKSFKSLSFIRQN